MKFVASSIMLAMGFVSSLLMQVQAQAQVQTLFDGSGDCQYENSTPEFQALLGWNVDITDDQFCTALEAFLNALDDVYAKDEELQELDLRNLVITMSDRTVPQCSGRRLQQLQQQSEQRSLGLGAGICGFELRDGHCPYGSYMCCMICDFGCGRRLELLTSETKTVTEIADSKQNAMIEKSLLNTIEHEVVDKTLIPDIMKFEISHAAIP